MSGYTTLSHDDYNLASEPIHEFILAACIYIFFCSAAILLVAAIFKICEYFVLRRGRLHPPAANDAAASIEIVIVPRDAAPAADYAAAVSALPTYTYAELMRDPATAAAAAAVCAICLAHYKDGQEARLLPECGHVFHRNCADMWLTGHPTCPICRASTVAEEPAAAQPLVVGR